MEIHVELKTASKMFCGCKNDPFFAEKPNIYTCPVCLGMPGGLPAANKRAVEWTIKLGLALGCSIAQFSKFDRKHYFYPDLSKGYQISQYDQPLCEHGLVKTEYGDVRIQRVHLEEDTGKLQHTTIGGKKVSLIDFNRCGVPLVEIVTEPDIHSPQQAKVYAKKIQELVRTLNISLADMEKGSMRLEANISLTTNTDTLPPYKVEAKNINSFRFLEQAILFEVERQEAILEKGETPRQETRGWSETKHATVSQRSKEEAEDYRYFPDPDLPPMVFSADEIRRLHDELPELPDTQFARFISLGVKEDYARILSAADHNTAIIDAAFSLSKTMGFTPQIVASYIINQKVDTKSSSAENIILQIQERKSVDVVSNNELKKVIETVLLEQQRAVQDYRAGKTQVLGFILGMVMRKLGKKIDPASVSAMISTLIGT